MSGPGDSSRTNLKKAKIDNSNIATGTNSRVYAISTPGHEDMQQISRLVSNLRRQLAIVDEDPELAGPVSQVKGSLTELESELASAAPRRPRLASLLDALSAGSDLVTLSGPIGALVVAVRAYFNL